MLPPPPKKKGKQQKREASEMEKKLSENIANYLDMKAFLRTLLIF